MCICNDVFLKDQNSIKGYAFFKSIVVLYLEDFEYDELDLVAPPNKWITSTTIETCRNPGGGGRLPYERGGDARRKCIILFYLFATQKLQKNIGKEEKKRSGEDTVTKR